VSRIFRTFGLAERHPALAHAVMAPLICWSFSSSMFRYLFVDHAVPAMWRNLAAARLTRAPGTSTLCLRWPGTTELAGRFLLKRKAVTFLLFPLPSHLPKRNSVRQVDAALKRDGLRYTLIHVRG
jgi:hypothetical protein